MAVLDEGGVVQRETADFRPRPAGPGHGGPGMGWMRYNRRPMKLIINGQDKEVAAQTVAQLLERLEMADRPVGVEVNRQLVPKRDHARTRLSDGDTVELVTLVGGG